MMRTLSFSIKATIAAIAVYLAACSPSSDPTVGMYPDNFVVEAYYQGDSTQAVNYPIAKLTHLIYSFMHLQGNKLTIDNETEDRHLKNLVSLKENNPRLKVLLSLGGWGGCETCSEVFSTEQGRNDFIASVKESLLHYNADGIDLDWEYPTVEGYPGHPYKAEDKQNFTALIQGLRTALGDQYELSFAAGAYTEFLEKAVEWDRIMPLVDRVNLMTYDLTNGFSVTTGHHSPLYSTAQQKESTDNAVQYLLKLGVDPQKIVIGAAFYARVWENVEADADGNVLYRPGSFKEAVSYKDFGAYFTSDFEYYWDDTAQAGYFYNPAKKLFATFDDPRSVMMKTEYALNNKLGGIMFWELTSDKYGNGLLTAISNTVIMRMGSQNQ